MSDKHPLRIASQYLLATCLTIAILIVLLRLWKADLSVPFNYHGDALNTGMSIKTIAEQGWLLHNSRLGAPFELDVHDFPEGGLLHFAIIKLMTYGTHDPGLIYNLYFLLTIPLTALTSLFVMRRFGCAYPVALVFSVLYAFLPYRFCNPALTIAFYLVPLMVMVILWLYQDPEFLLTARENKGPRFAWLSGKTWACALICVLLASSFVYFAFFACFFLMLTGLSGCLSRKTLRPLKPTFFLVTVIVLASVANILPAFLYAREHGGNPDAARRNMGEAEHFGLRMAQMLMPVSNHRLSFLAYVKSRFNAKLAMVTENDFTALGVVGSAGFLLLIGRLLVRSPAVTQSSEVIKTSELLLEPLSRLNVFAVLLGTLGGFGLLFAAVLPQIRSYNRVSIYIGFFSLFALALAVDGFYRKLSGSSGKRWLAFAGLAALLAVGVLDQTPGTWASIPSDEKRLAEFYQDADFVKQIEVTVPAQSMIYQLPYTLFPEGTNYELLRCYFHSSTLRWSYPTMRGREGDFWNRGLVRMAPDELVPTLVFAGFSGIVIDRAEMGDKSRALEAQLNTLLKTKPMTSANERFSFYELTAFAEEKRGQMTAAQWQENQERVLHPVMVGWFKGFSRDLDVSAQGGRWCAGYGEMSLINASDHPQKVNLSLTLRPGLAQPAHVRIASPFFTRELTIDAKEGLFEESLTVPPGRHTLRFTCDGKAWNDDPRRIFKVVDYRLRAEPAAAGVAQTPASRVP